MINSESRGVYFAQRSKPSGSGSNKTVVWIFWTCNFLCKTRIFVSQWGHFTRKSEYNCRWCRCSATVKSEKSQTFTCNKVDLRCYDRCSCNNSCLKTVFQLICRNQPYSSFCSRDVLPRRQLCREAHSDGRNRCFPQEEEFFWAQAQPSEGPLLLQARADLWYG